MLQLKWENLDIIVHIQLIRPNGSILYSYCTELSSSLAHVTATISSFGRAHSGNYTCMAMYTFPNNSFLIDSDPKSDMIRVTVGKSS